MYLCGTCPRSGPITMSQFLFIAPFPDNRQAFTQCRLPPSLPQRHNVTCLELVRDTDGQRGRDKAGPKFISPSRIIFPQILMGLAPVARRARSLASASRSPFAVGGPPKIRMPPPRRLASERPKQPRKKRREIGEPRVTRRRRRRGGGRFLRY